MEWFRLIVLAAAWPLSALLTVAGVAAFRAALEERPGGGGFRSDGNHPEANNSCGT